MNGRAPNSTPLFDRLRDHEHTGRRGSPRRPEDFIAKDLEQLLNTRLPASTTPAVMEKLEGSNLNYGIPDIAGVAQFVEEERDRLRDAIEQSVTRFEPRLKRVRVYVLKPTDEMSRQLSFRIVASVGSQNADRRQIQLDAAVQPGSTSLRVLDADPSRETVNARRRGPRPTPGGLS